MAPSSSNRPNPETHHTEPNLDLSSAPPIFILSTHIPTDQLHALEDSLYASGAQVTYQAKEASLFLGKVAQKKRAAFELRSRKVWTEEVDVSAFLEVEDGEEERGGEPVRKKRRKVKVRSDEGNNGSERKKGRKGLSSGDRVDEGSSESESEVESGQVSIDDGAEAVSWPNLEDHVMVIKLEWLEKCQKQNKLIPYRPYIVYTGKRIPRPPDERSSPVTQETITYIKAMPETTSPTSNSARPAHYNRTSPTSARRSPTLNHHARPPPKLHRTTTSEHESLAQAKSSSVTHINGTDSSSIPPAPEWVRKNLIYACQRDTPANPINAAFIAQLETIKDARLLTLDDIGVRAYSTSIASIAAYPYKIHHAAEILRLPGCDTKIATLWTEWIDSIPEEETQNMSEEELEKKRIIPVVRDLNADEDLKHLKLFWQIWGVGPDTARKFYFEFGWKDLDDVVEFGWNNLNRVQQIGVKFYDEFLVNIPRKEVEEIRDVVLDHARKCKGIDKNLWGTMADMEVVIVGGYRRGKELSGDVDVIVSHRDEHLTKDLVVDIVRSLEEEGYVTHTLTLQTTTSDRGQQTLPYRAHGGGHGFDSLDKALCVWQDPVFDDKKGKITKNPNIHRRVDIIVSVWRTVGCAVLGWSGGNTFQRDIRRYVTKMHGWKFDSTGVRNKGNGMVVDLESPRKEGDEDGWLDREKRLMDGMGIGWREPRLRCTG